MRSPSYAELEPFEAAARRKGVALDTLRDRVRTHGVTIFADGRDRRRKLVRVTDIDRVFAPKPLRKEAA